MQNEWKIKTSRKFYYADLECFNDYKSEITLYRFKIRKRAQQKKEWLKSRKGTIIENRRHD